jgi:hypothetical protein
LESSVVQGRRRYAGQEGNGNRERLFCWRFEGLGAGAGIDTLGGKSVELELESLKGTRNLKLTIYE